MISVHYLEENNCEQKITGAVKAKDAAIANALVKRDQLHSRTSAQGRLSHV